MNSYILYLFTFIPHTLTPSFMTFVILICFLLFPGCAEKRVPDDEQIREYLYAIKPLEMWQIVSDNKVTHLDDVNKILDQKTLRKYMRISEMDADKYSTICNVVAKKSIQDAGFFMNNSRGRKNFEELNALKSSSPDQYEQLVKRRCHDTFLMLKGRAKKREFIKRQSLITDTP